MPIDLLCALEPESLGRELKRRLEHTNVSLAAPRMKDLRSALRTATPDMVVASTGFLPANREAWIGEIRSLPETPDVVLLHDREDTTFRVSDWVVASVRGGGYLGYPDIMVFHIMQQSLGDRPVYFAATAPPVYEIWGLQPHLVRHGLAFKVVDEPLMEDEHLVNLEEHLSFQSPAWVDRSRTRALLEEVFEVDYLLGWDEWPEPSTRSSIPTQYYLVYLLQGLAEARIEDRMAAAEEAFRRADHFAWLSRLIAEPPPAQEPTG